MLVTLSTTGTVVELTKTAGGAVAIKPMSKLIDGDSANLAGLITLFNSSAIAIDDMEKDAVVAVPNGQTQQSVATQPSQPGQGIPQLVTADEFSQVRQQVQQLSSMVEKLTAQLQPQGQQASAQPTPQPQPAAPQPAAPQPAPPAQQPKMARGLV